MYSKTRVLFVSCLVHFLLAPFASADAFLRNDTSSHRHHHATKFGDPFMDKGRICREKEEMVQETVFENQIHCDIEMQEKCEEMSEACHTVYERECEVFYRPQMTKVKVRVCPEDEVDLADAEDDVGHNSVVIDVRPPPPHSRKETSSDCDAAGFRRICVEKMETECSTEMVSHRMREDRPNCRVRTVDSCRNRKKEEGGVKIFEAFRKKKDDDDDMVCEKVKAVRCKIEKKMVTKTKPETKCRRVPHQQCRKERCDRDKEDTSRRTAAADRCYFRTQVVNEMIPEEKCNFVPHRMCHPVRKSRQRTLRTLSDRRQARALLLDSGPPNMVKDARGCVRAPVQRCRTVRTNPRQEMRPKTMRECRDPDPRSRDDARIVRRLLLGGGV